MSEPESNLTQKAVRGGLWTAISQYWLFAVGLGRVAILSRIIAPEYYGALAVAVPWVTYITFFRFDFRPAVINSEESDVLSHTQFWLENAFALLAFPVAGLVYLLLPAQYALDNNVWAMIIALIALVQFESVYSTSRYLLEKRMRHDVLGRLQIIAGVLWFIVPVLFAWQGYFLTAVFFEFAIPNLVTGIGILIVQPWLPKLRWGKEEARLLLDSGFTMWTNGLLGKIVFQFDDWLVGSFRRTGSTVWLSAGKQPAAFYYRSYSAGKMPMDIFAGMIGAIALPLYSSGAAEGLPTLQSVYRRVTWLLTYMIALSSTYALIATEEVLLILLGDNWGPTVPIFRLMVLFIVGRPMYQNAIQLLLAIKKEKEARYTTFIQAIFLLVACPVAVYFYGAGGAAITISIMTIIGVILAEQMVTQQLEQRYWPMYVIPLIVSALVAIGTWLINPFLPANILLSATIKGLFCVAVFATAIFAFQRQQALDVYAYIREGMQR